MAQTFGASPRPPGSLAAIRDDGILVGSVSGGCIEDDLVAKVRGADGSGLAIAKPERIKYGISAEEANRFGLPCGGTIELVMEPIGARSRIDDLVAALEGGQRLRRILDLDSGDVTLEPADAFDRRGDTLAMTDRTLSTLHGPSWRLMIIGAGQMTLYLAQMAQALDYGIIVCDPREEYTAQWQVPGSTLTTEMPDDAVIAMKPDAHSAIVALTHDPKLDDLALMEALKSRAFYVGALGSRANNAKRRQRLREFDLTDSEIARLHGPIGLYIGSRTPPEIAVSILAEVTAVKNGVALPDVASVALGKEKLEPSVACESA